MRTDPYGFVECEKCSKKSGSSTLCSSCFLNRKKIYELAEEVAKERMRYSGAHYRGWSEASGWLRHQARHYPIDVFPDTNPAASMARFICDKWPEMMMHEKTKA